MTPANLEYILYELFAGRATPIQKKLIEEWLRKPGNDEVYYRYVARWEADHRQFEPDTPTALAAYQAFMNNGQPYARRTALNQSPTIIRRFNSRWLWSVAASVVLLGAWLTQPRWAYRHYAVPYGQTETVRLADGSTVWLNAHSTLRVPRFGFGQGEREVWLSGEGYFSVARTASRQRFVVHTNALDVQVLGTKFNVNTRRGKTEVVLSEGKVQLVAPQARPLTMKPGESVALAERDTAFRKLAVKPETRTAWQERRLVFDETPLSQVAQQIEDYYGVKVVLGSHELARRELTGTLPNNDLTVVLKTLSVSYNLAVERQKDRIVLR